MKHKRSNKCSVKGSIPINQKPNTLETDGDLVKRLNELKIKSTYVSAPIKYEHFVHIYY